MWRDAFALYSYVKIIYIVILTETHRVTTHRDVTQREKALIERLRRLVIL